MPRDEVHVAVAVAALTLLSACDKDRDSKPPGDPVEGKRVLDLAFKESEGRDKDRREGLLKAQDEVVPRADLGACSEKIRVPTFAMLAYDGKSVTTAGRLSENWSSDMNIVALEKLATTSGPKRAFLEDHLHPLGGILPADTDTNGVYFKDVKALAEGPGWTYDTTLVIDSLVAPVTLDRATYAPGALRGRMYTWSYPEKRVICAANVVVQSSPEMKIIGDTKDEKDAMLNDLRHTAVRKGVELLVAAGPKLPAAPADAGTKPDAGKATSKK